VSPAGTPHLHPIPQTPQRAAMWHPVPPLPDHRTFTPSHRHLNGLRCGTQYHHCRATAPSPHPTDTSTGRDVALSTTTAGTPHLHPIPQTPQRAAMQLPIQPLPGYRTFTPSHRYLNGQRCGTQYHHSRNTAPSPHPTDTSTGREMAPNTTTARLPHLHHIPQIPQRAAMQLPIQLLPGYRTFTPSHRYLSVQKQFIHCRQQIVGNGIIEYIHEQWHMVFSTHFLG
jgi:hypothetical protein